MHTLLLMSLLLTSPAPKKPTSSGLVYSTQTHQSTWQNQLNSLIHYPDMLKPTAWGATVMLRFQVDSRQRITSVEVFSPNKSLNRELIDQLTGQRLPGLPINPGTFQFVKVHFI